MVQTDKNSKSSDGSDTWEVWGEETGADLSLQQSHFYQICLAWMTVKKYSPYLLTYTVHSFVLKGYQILINVTGFEKGKWIKMHLKRSWMGANRYYLYICKQVMSV